MHGLSEDVFNFSMLNVIVLIKSAVNIVSLSSDAQLSVTLKSDFSAEEPVIYSCLCTAQKFQVPIKRYAAECNFLL
jgi:hypothetical protein